LKTIALRMQSTMIMQRGNILSRYILITCSSVLSLKFTLGYIYAQNTIVDAKIAGYVIS
jgi:hypothetical protein